MQNHQSSCTQVCFSAVYSLFPAYFRQPYLDRECSTDAVVQMMVSISFINVCTYLWTNRVLIALWLIFADCSISNLFSTMFVETKGDCDVINAM